MNRDRIRLLSMQTLNLFAHPEVQALDRYCFSQLIVFPVIVFPSASFFIALKGTGGNDFAIGSLMWTWSAWLSLHWNCKGVEQCIISRYSSWTVISFTRCTSSYNEQAFIRLLCLLLTYQNVADHWRQEKKKEFVIFSSSYYFNHMLCLSFCPSLSLWWWGYFYSVGAVSSASLFLCL